MLFSHLWEKEESTNKNENILFISEGRHFTYIVWGSLKTNTK